MSYNNNETCFLPSMGVGRGDVEGNRIGGMWRGAEPNPSWTCLAANGARTQNTDPELFSCLSNAGSWLIWITKTLNTGIPRQDIELRPELKFPFLFQPANPANPASPAEECGCVRLGKCKWFNVAKGWGFLTPNDGGQEVFVHQVGTNN